MLTFRFAAIDTPSWPLTVLSSASWIGVMAEAEKAAVARAAAMMVLFSCLIFISKKWLWLFSLHQSRRPGRWVAGAGKHLAAVPVAAGSSCCGQAAPVWPS